MHLVLTAMEQKKPAGIDQHFRPIIYLCDLRLTAPFYATIPYSRLAEGWAAVARTALRSSPGLPAERVAGTVEDFFTPHRNSSKIAGVRAEREQHATTSADLVAQREADAAAGPSNPNSDVLRRIRAFYEGDYALLRSAAIRWVVPPTAAELGAA